MKLSIMSIVMALFVSLFSVNAAMCQKGASALKDNTFVMAAIRPETQYFGKWQRLVYAEIFRRLGIKAEFRLYPPKRATMEADAGNVDGEPARPYKYADEHPVLIRIEESVFDVNYSAFAVQTSIPQLNGWNSLRGTNYRVEHRRGIKICEINLPKVVNRKNLSTVTDSVQGLKKLLAERTDVFVDEESGILTLLQTPGFKNRNIRSAGIMEFFPVYSYLHKKNTSLAPKMAQIIKAMKAEGLIEQYRNMLDKEFGVVRSLKR